MPLKPAQLTGALQRGLSPVYLFAGAEPLLVQECRDQVWETAKSQGFLEREIRHADRSFDWEDLAAAGGAPSLFASRKIIDLRLPTGKPGREGAKVLTAWAAEPDPDLLLVISCEQWDKSSRNSKWAAAIDRAGTRVDIWPVSPNELPGWINGRMRAVGLEPDQGAVMLLAERLEGNLLAAQQEIEKLLLIKGGGPVSEEDVMQAVADSSRFDAFLLVERVLSGNLADGLRVASGLHRTGVPVQMIIGALYRDLRILETYMMATRAGENEAQVFRKLNIWRSRQAPMRQAAARLNFNRLMSAFSRMSLIDRQSKGRASGDPWHALDHLVRELCGPA
jgi:DNA polymerase-3 subunit delta